MSLYMILIVQKDVDENDYFNFTILKWSLYI